MGSEMCIRDRFWEAAGGLLEAWSRSSRAAVRLIGVGVSQLTGSEVRQLSLFESETGARQRQLDRTMDEIRERYGDDAVSRGGARPFQP